jgi:hypothetical protein
VSVSRLNYTGRKRIQRDCVSIGVSGSPPNAVVGASFRLGDLGFPGAARVVLEAYAGWIVQRFDFGTIDQITSPTDARLSEFDSTAGLLFRLKVVGTGDRDGRLLGVADRLHPSAEFDTIAQQSFVVVRPQDLGDRVWKLELDPSQPLLLVNNRIVDHHDFLKRRDVAALLLPEVLSQLLRFAIETGEEEDGSGWIGTTLRIGTRLAGREAPPSAEEEEVQRWTDEVVGAFARRHQFIDAIIGGELGADQ